MKPGTLLRMTMIGSLGGLSVILIGPSSPAAVWAGTAVYGFFMGPIFPTAVVFASGAMRMSGKVTGLFLVGASAGGMLVPWLIGQLFEAVGPMAVIATIFCTLAVAALTLSVVRRLAKA
jgi:fucose permease